MVKLYSHVVGNTLGSDKTFLKKLGKKGAKKVKDPKNCDAIIVFCPIASRYKTDMNAALTNLPERKQTLKDPSQKQKVVLVAMHHTFDPNYTLPSYRDVDTADIDVLFVDCLFHENKGLLKCECNKMAIKKICKELKIKKFARIKKMLKKKRNTSVSRTRK